MTGLTYHLVLRDFWQAQDSTCDYSPEPVQSGREDFIHCTDGALNLAATANRHYRHTPGDFIALVIDLAKVTAPAKYEDVGQIYPHIYGPLNRAAIISLVEVPRTSEVEFLPPLS